MQRNKKNNLTFYDEDAIEAILAYPETNMIEYGRFFKWGWYKKAVTRTKKQP